MIEFLTLLGIALALIPICALTGHWLSLRHDRIVKREQRRHEQDMEAFNHIEMEDEEV